MTAPCGTPKGDAVDSATVSFLQMALKKEEEEEEEREQAAKLDEELEDLLSIPVNQFTLPQRRRRVDHYRSGAAQAYIAAVLAKEKDKKKKKKKRKRRKKRQRTRRTRWRRSGFLLCCSS